MNLRAIVSALWYLRSRSIANAFKARLLRLKKPKYLIGGLVGFGYIYSMFFYRLFAARAAAPTAAGPGGDALRLLFQDIAALGVFLFAASFWVFGGSSATLRLSEAESAFLLSGPLNRRWVIRYRLISSLGQLLVSALIFSILAGRFLQPGAFLSSLLGWWLVLVTMNLHSIASSFTIQRLTEDGLASWKRRLLAAALALGVAGAVAAWTSAIPAPPTPDVDVANLQETFGKYAAWAHRALGGGVGRWLFAPWRWLTAPWFARTPGQFLAALGPALLVVGAHVWWVENSDASFEEATLALAKRRAAVIAAARSGKLGTLRRRKAAQSLFHLAPTGWAGMAIVWRNLIDQGINRRSIRWLAAVAIIAVVGPRLVMGEIARGIFVSTAGAIALAMTVLGAFAGIQALARDFEHFEVYKTVATPGRRLMEGHLIGSLLPLWAAQAVCAVSLVATLAGGSFQGETVPVGSVFAAALGGLLVAWPLTAVLRIIPTAAALLFPGWVQPKSGQAAGPEMMGQRMLILLGSLVVCSVSAAPAALLAWLGWWSGHKINAPAGFVFAGLLAGVILAVETYWGCRFLGRLFDRFDLSEEF